MTKKSNNDFIPEGKASTTGLFARVNKNVYDDFIINTVKHPKKREKIIEELLIDFNKKEEAKKC